METCNPAPASGAFGGHEAPPTWCRVYCFMVRWSLFVILGTLRVTWVQGLLAPVSSDYRQPTQPELSVAHLEAGQKLGSKMLSASTATLVPGCDNRIIVPSEKKDQSNQQLEYEPKTRVGNKSAYSDNSVWSFSCFGMGSSDSLSLS